METLKTAVIGVGMMGQHHVRVYSELPNSELVGIADINLKRARELAGEYGGFPYKDYKEMLEKEKPDAVSVVVPTKLHTRIGGDVLERTNALVEKPIAESVKSAEKLIHIAKKCNHTLMVGHIERFNPAIEFFKDWANRKKIEYLSLSAVRIGPPNLRPGIDTGVIVDLGIHDIDMIRYLTGKEVKGVDAVGRKFLKNSPAEDHAHIWLNLGDISGSVVTNRVTSRKVRRLNVSFLDGYVEIDYITGRIRLYAQYGRPDDRLLWHPERVIEVKYEEPLKKELAHFLDCISHNKEPRITGEDALESLKVALEAEKIARRRMK